VDLSLYLHFHFDGFLVEVVSVTMDLFLSHLNVSDGLFTLKFIYGFSPKIFSFSVLHSLGSLVGFNETELNGLRR
jgi:hypothetical protein